MILTPQQRQAQRNDRNTAREQGSRVAKATDLENTRNSRGGRNTQRAIRNRAAGNADQRRH